MIYKVLFTLVNGDMEIFNYYKDPRAMIKHVLEQKYSRYFLQGNKLILIDKIVKIEFMDLQQNAEKQSEIDEEAMLDQVYPISNNWGLLN